MGDFLIDESFNSFKKLGGVGNCWTVHINQRIHNGVVVQVNNNFCNFISIVHNVECFPHIPACKLSVSADGSEGKKEIGRQK